MRSPFAIAYLVRLGAVSAATRALAFAAEELAAAAAALGTSSDPEINVAAERIAAEVADALERVRAAAPHLLTLSR